MSDTPDLLPETEPVPRPADFDDELYLRLNPDVAGAVARGIYATGFEHYMKYGAAERRRYRHGPDAPGAAPPRPPDAAAVAGANGLRSLPAVPGHGVERLIASTGGSVFIAGWIDDASDPLADMLLEGDGWLADLGRDALVRVRRRDVEAALTGGRAHSYGYWSFCDLGRALPRRPICRLHLRMRSGAGVIQDMVAEDAADTDLRDLALEQLAAGDFFGNPHAGAIASLDGGLGGQIIAATRRLTAVLTANPAVERFGSAVRRPRVSLVVCLYGRAEYLYLQNALFANGAGIEDYELIYVCNSPELADRLLDDARIAGMVHGLRQTLVLLPGNAGFAAASNLAVNYAGSDRIVALNPDVFPRQPDWARRHLAVTDGLPAAQTALFGVPLFYSDGSLMHGGMFFEIDNAVLPEASGLRRRELVRVEHYGKGAPPQTSQFLRARPVPAVTGAFLSVRRDWFEKLGGFDQDYVFGHYEDADLCLRSLAHGTPAWLHDIRLWHLEGKGSSRLRAHEGSALVNRWLFSRRWANEVHNGLLGPMPTHRLLTEPAGTGDAPPMPVKPRGETRAAGGRRGRAAAGGGGA